MNSYTNNEVCIILSGYAGLVVQNTFICFGTKPVINSDIISVLIFFEFCDRIFSYFQESEAAEMTRYPYNNGIRAVLFAG